MSQSTLELEVPDWALAYLEERAHNLHTSQAAVLVEALARLRSADFVEFLKESYQDMVEELYSQEPEEEVGATIVDDALLEVPRRTHCATIFY